jgi:methylmalonyl-CoA/ethylmalonyl-CoA epimerase
MRRGADDALHFHHVGVACTDIRAEATRWTVLGYAAEGAEFVDERQGVRGVFMAGQAPRLELLEPLASERDGVLTPWIRQEVKLYHLAYTVATLAGAIDRMRAQGAKLVVPPVAAVAFGGRDIAFLMLPNRALIELISSP